MLKREDCSYLLDEMSTIYENARFKDGMLIDKDDNHVSADVDNKFSFYLLYMETYREIDDPSIEATVREDYEPFYIAKSYNMFNTIINILLMEYQVYGDINTSKVNYYPYEKAIDYLFRGEYGKYAVEEILEARKATIINFLESVFNLKDCKRRVKK